MKPWNVTVIETEPDGVTKREAQTELHHDFADEAAVRAYFKRFKHVEFVKAEPIPISGEGVQFEPAPAPAPVAEVAAATILGRKRSKSRKGK